MSKQLILMVDTKDFPRNLRGDNEFCWFFLGRDYERLVSLKEKTPSTFNFIDLGDRLNDISLQLRRPYIDYIASLSTKLASLPWWISPISEKNVMGSPVFLYICYIFLIKEMLDNELKDKNICIISESEVLLETISRSDWIYGYKIMKLYFYRFSICVAYCRLLYRMFKFAQKNLQRKISAIITNKKNINNTNLLSSELTILRTWVGENNLGNDGNFKDSYFPDLYNYLHKNNGDNVAILPIIYNTKRPYIDVLRWFRKSPTAFIIPEDYYTFSDYFRVVIISFQSILLMFSKFIFKNIDLTLLFRRESINCVLLGESDQVLMHYFLMKRIADKNIKIKKVIMTFENMSPEKPLIVGIKKYLPRTKILGFQHCSLFPLLLCWYTSEIEAKVLPMPEKIICSGKFFKDILINEGYPTSRLTIGPALRFQYLLKLSMNDNVSQQNNIILIVLPLVYGSALELLSKTWKCLKDKKELKILIKPHPMMLEEEFQHIINKIGMEKNSFLTIKMAMTDILPTVTMLIATASAAVFDAVACGIPVIRVRSDIDLNLDPMDWFPRDEMQFIARLPLEIANKVEQILMLNEVQIQQLKENGKRLIEMCFSPTTEETLAAFL